MKRNLNEKVQIRSVAGALRGRKVACVVTPTLRPTPQMVPEAYFSILGDAVPERLFIDIFAGTRIKSNFICSVGTGDPSGLFGRSPRLSFDEACKIV